jgi:hypothetical protein
MWTTDGSIRNHSPRRYHCVGVDYHITSNVDVIQTKETVSLYTESTDLRCINPTVVLQVQQVAFAQCCPWVNYDIFANTSTEHSIIKDLERRMHGKNALSGRPA